jgi:hypothetical protein
MYESSTSGHHNFLAQLVFTGELLSTGMEVILVRFFGCRNLHGTFVEKSHSTTMMALA